MKVVVKPLGGELVDESVDGGDEEAEAAPVAAGLESDAAEEGAGETQAGEAADDAAASEDADAAEDAETKA